MVNKALSTLEKIHVEGKKEFMEKGFKDASLRNIVKRAGVTLGAFYGYYPAKDALFEALVTPTAKDFKSSFLAVQQDFDALPVARKASELHTYSNEALFRLLDFVYEHFDVFKLIICCSAGTAYEHYIDSLVAVEEESTYRFMKAMKNSGHPINDIKPNLSHILASSYFAAIFETVAHDMPKDEAVEYMGSLTTFFGAGWDAVLGLP